MRRFLYHLLSLAMLLGPVGLSAQSTRVAIGWGNLYSSMSPFTNYYENGLSQSIYLASEIGTSGVIDTIWYDCTETSTHNFNTLKIYIKQVSNTVFTNTGLSLTEADLVYSRTNGTLGTTSGWVPFVLDNPVVYDGTQNLLIGVSRQANEWSGSLTWRCTSSDDGCVAVYDDNDASYGVMENFNDCNSGVPEFRERANIRLSISPLTGNECIRPTLTGMPQVTDNSVALTWRSTGASTYEYILTDGENDVTGSTSDTTVTLTGLQSGTTYQLQLRSICGGSHSSYLTKDITTSHHLAQLPYSVNFQNAADNACWVLNTTQANNHFMVGTDARGNGNNSLYITNDDVTNSYSSENPNGLETTAFAWRDLNFATAGDYTVTLDWRCYGYYEDDYARLFLVPVSSGLQLSDFGQSMSYYFNHLPSGFIQLDGRNGTSYYDEELMLYNDSTWRSDSYQFSITQPGAYKLVAMWHDDEWNSGHYPLAIDNLNISSLTCPAPTHLTLVSRDTNSVSLRWNRGESESSWILIYGEEGGGTRLQMMVSDTTATLHNLAYATTYEIVVRSLCGVGDTSVPATLTVTTRCTDGLALPYADNFNDRPYGNVADQQTCYMTGGSGDDDCAMFFSSNLRMASSDAPYFLTMPTFATQLNHIRLTMDLATLTSAIPGHLKVGYMTDPTDLSSFEEVETLELPVAGSATGVEVTYEFLPDNAAGHIAFLVDGRPYDYMAGMFIDNLSIVEVPTCRKPYELSAGNITATTARVAYRTSLPMTAFEMAYSTHRNFNPDTCSAALRAVSTENYVDLSGLTPLTQYYCRVRSNCGNTYGEWNNEVCGFVTLSSCTAGTPVEARVGTEQNNTQGSEFPFAKMRHWHCAPNTTVGHWYHTGDQRTWQIYTAEELNLQGLSEGNLNGIGFKYSGTRDSMETITCRIYLVETDYDGLDVTTVPALSQMRQVYEGTMTFNNVDQWGFATFDSLFHYTGRRNLMLAVENTLPRDPVYHVSDVYNADRYITNFISTTTAHPMSVVSYTIDTDEPHMYTSESRSIARFYACAEEHDGAPVVTVDTVGATSARLHWNSLGNGYEVSYGVAGGQFTTVAVNDTTITLSNLQTDRHYGVMVRLHSGSTLSGWSAMQYFHTVSDQPVALPYCQSFDIPAGVADSWTPEVPATYPFNYLPSGWSVLGASTSIGEKPYVAMRATDFDTALWLECDLHPLFVVLPTTAATIDQLRLNAEVEAWGDGVRLDVGVIAHPDDPATFRVLQSFENEELHNSGTIEHHFSIDSIGPDDRHIALMVISTELAGVHRLILDDLCLTLDTACFASVSVGADQITAHTAHLYWRNREGNNYDVRYGTHARYDRSGGGLVSAPEELTQLVTTSSPELLLSGLNSYQDYYYTIRTHCDDATSLWTPIRHFRTAMDCADSVKIDLVGRGPENPYPYLPGRESTVWMLYTAEELNDMGLFDGTLQALEFNLDGSTENFHSERIYLAETSLTALTPADTMALSQMTLVYSADTISRAVDQTTHWNTRRFATPFLYSGNGNLLVAVKSNVPMSEMAASYKCHHTEHPQMVLHTVIADPGNYWGIRFDYENYSESDEYVGLGEDTLVPNIRFVGCSTEPACSLPHHMTVDYVGYSEVGVSWSSTATSFEVSCTDGEGHQTTFTTTDHNAVIANLNASADYTIKVRSLCGTPTRWGKPMEVTTQCAPLALDYAQDFEHLDSLDWGQYITPDCWSALHDEAVINYNDFSNRYLQVWNIDESDMAISPFLNAGTHSGANLSYRYRAFNWGDTVSYPAHLYVRCGQGGQWQSLGRLAYTGDLNFDTLSVAIPLTDSIFQLGWSIVAQHQLHLDDLLIEGTDLTYYNIIASVNDTLMGSILGAGTYLQGDTVTLVARPAAHHHLVAWNDQLLDTVRTLVVDRDTTFSATFAPNQYYVSMAFESQSGISQGHFTGSGYVPYGQSTTIAVHAAPHFTFVRWSDGNTDSVRTVYPHCDTTFYAIMQVQHYNITVSAEHGSVQGDGTYGYGDSVTLVATPHLHYLFSMWSDSVTDNPRRFVATHHMNLTALFVPSTHNVSSQPLAYDATGNLVTGNGTITGTGLYNHGQTATLTALPADHHHFVAWSDQSTLNPRDIVVTSDTTLNAIFAIDQHNLFTWSDTTYGRVMGAGVYNYGDTATLTTQPMAHYHFDHWNDQSTDNPRRLVVTQDSTINGYFAPNIYHITTLCDSVMGTVSGGGAYTYLDTCTLTAVPQQHTHFLGWNDQETDNPRSFIVIGDSSYTAYFEWNSYPITVVSADSVRGSVSGSGTFVYNTYDTITATAHYGYHFDHWNDGNTQNPRIVHVEGPATYTATFERNSYVVTAQTSGATGSVTGAGTYLYLDTCTLTAVPGAHSHFIGWNDQETDNPRSFVVTRDSSFTAHFEWNSYAITVVSSDTVRGSVSGSGTFVYNTYDTIAATAHYGYHFDHWNDGSTQNPRAVLVEGEATYTATFERNSYVVSAQTSGATGSVSGAGTYLYLDTCILTAVPGTHSHFVSWSDQSTDNPRSFVVTRDSSLTAYFDWNSYAITVVSEDTARGNVSGSGTFVYNSYDTISATANYGYHFTQWNDGNTQNPRVVLVEGPATYTATFERNTYHVMTQVVDTASGSITGGGYHQYLDTVVLSAVANPHYHFVSWSDQETLNPRMVVVTRDTLFGALFALDQVSVSVMAVDSNRQQVSWGTVQGAGVYSYGDQVTLSAFTTEGYEFRGWMVDGVILTTESFYTFTATTDVLIEGLFAPIPTHVLTLVADGNGTIRVNGQEASSHEGRAGEEIRLEAVADPGYKFVGWSNGETEALISYTMTDGDVTLTAYFERNLSIDEVDGLDIKVGVNRTRIIVYGAEGRQLTIYDISGRRLDHVDKASASHIFEAPASGVYLIRSGNEFVQKVVVAR